MNMEEHGGHICERIEHKLTIAYQCKVHINTFTHTHTRKIDRCCRLSVFQSVLLRSATTAAALCQMSLDLVRDDVNTTHKCI